MSYLVDCPRNLRNLEIDARSCMPISQLFFLMCNTSYWDRHGDWTQSYIENAIKNVNNSENYAAAGLTLNLTYTALKLFTTQFMHSGEFAKGGSRGGMYYAEYSPYPLLDKNKIWRFIIDYSIKKDAVPEDVYINDGWGMIGSYFLQNKKYPEDWIIKK